MSKEEGIWAWVEDQWKQAERKSWEEGIELFVQGNFDAALRSFQEAGSAPKVMFNIGVCYSQLKQYDVADGFFEKVLRESSRDEAISACASFMRAVCLHHQRSFSQSIHEFTRALMAVGDRPLLDLKSDGLEQQLRRADVLYNRALSMGCAGRFDEALADLKWALEDVTTEQLEAKKAEMSGGKPSRSSSQLKGVITLIDELASQVTKAQISAGPNQQKTRGRASAGGVASKTQTTTPPLSQLAHRRSLDGTESVRRILESMEVSGRLTALGSDTGVSPQQQRESTPPTVSNRALEYRKSYPFSGPVQIQATQSLSGHQPLLYPQSSTPELLRRDSDTPDSAKSDDFTSVFKPRKSKIRSVSFGTSSSGPGQKGSSSQGEGEGEENLS
mmetsp:Transcript_4660/g.7216  ORF Transcript_4660/g.7216 Transcript_4660/m.7216 type:complete len:388 (+) Transcript_4660:80-1243(+)